MPNNKNKVKNKNLDKEKLKNNLESFKNLKPNWDSYEALEINEKEVKLALEFLNYFRNSYNNLAYLGVFPLCNGGCEFEGSIKKDNKKIELSFIISFESNCEFNDLIKNTKVEIYLDLGTLIPDYSYYHSNNLKEAARFLNYLIDQYNNDKITEENFRYYFNN